MAGELITEDSHPIDSTSCLKVGLDVFRRGCIVDLASIISREKERR